MQLCSTRNSASPPVDELSYYYPSVHTDSREFERPAHLGPYRLDQLLGTGGMGEVWRAWDERLERWVALKQIRADATLSHGRERLRREARAVARFSHPSIVHIYDIVEDADGDWIVMELVEGRTLRDLLDEETALSPARAVKLCREIVEGLAEAHAHGILHRDLKASNVIVAPSGRAKILDFGLAKEMPREDGPERQETTVSTPGLILGTCFAMSPEQALGRDLDERSDLFSLGSLLYEMLTGEVPFRAGNPALTLARVVNDRLPPLQESHPMIPLELCELVDWLLQKEPHHRPESAAEVLAALEAAGGPAGREAVPVLRRPAGLDAPTATTVVDQPIVDNAHRQSGGERRTVTIVCCSLVQLDRPSREAGPLAIEALSTAAVAFESLGREVCRELSGSLGAALNRMLWLCFGYPQAHEDDAERAVRAARELQARFAALPVATVHRLAVRAGVHTGPAVVMAGPAAAAALQPGDTFDIAMAIQSQVGAGRIGVSAASRQLLRRRFATQPLPAVHVKDLDATVDVYELGSPVAAADREGGPWLPLVNREAELLILGDRFRLARSGSGQAVLIAGEAGIGKSRLVRALSEQLAAAAPTWLVAHGSAFGQNTPLAPIISLLEGTIFAPGGGGEIPDEKKLDRLEEVLAEYGLPREGNAPLLGALLSLATAERYPSLVLSPEARRKRTLAAILALLGARAAEQAPMVLVIEDLHWIDPSTLEFLDLLLRELPVLPLLLVATFRPEFTAPWPHRTSVTQLSLGGLSETHTAQLIDRVAEGKRLPSDVHRQIVLRTDGIPLFIEELTKTLLETDAPLREPAGIPFTLDGSLLARLDRLGDAKNVAQLAAVLGRTFSLELLEAFSRIKGAALQNALGRLVQADVLHRRGPAQGARYIFKHALIQDAAYLSLLASDRLQLHRRLARLLQEEFPAVAEPELMAHHCEHGGLAVEAVDYLQQAGLRAMQRSAHLEALSHLNRALDLLFALPATHERVMKELALRSMVAPALNSTKGWGASEVAVNSGRLVAICRELGDKSLLIPSLYGLWAHHVLKGDRRPANEHADEIARLAATPVQRFVGFSARVITTFYSACFAETLALAEQAAALYEPNLLPEFTQAFGEESSLLSHVYELWVLWILGRPDAAVRKRDALLATVEALRSPFQLGFALLFEMILWHELRDSERVDQVAGRLIRLSSEQEFPLLCALAHCGQGWAACRHGNLEAGTAQIRTGLDLHWATGARLPRGYWISYLIEAHLATGRLAEGLAAVRAALVQSETQLDVFFDAELLRLQGELLRASGETGAAETSLRQALGTAKAQGALAFELRAAASLARLLAEQGREDEALPPLAAAYQAHTEGLGTRDLVEARELLERLSPHPSTDPPGPGRDHHA
jgi:class 3 adenylate cyclase/tetratricopeptide (TPR) repeat protein/predicted Ser/Thr protein kinase